MAFTVEDGTGVTDANALMTVAEFDTFLSDRGIETFAYLVSEKEAAIVVSSVDYIDTFHCFNGTSLKETQGMQLPTDEVTIVAKIKRACAEGALLHLKKRLFVDPELIELNGQVILERDKLDVLESEKEYREGGNYTFKFPTNSIDRLLQPFTTNAGGIGSVKRW